MVLGNNSPMAECFPDSTFRKKEHRWKKSSALWSSWPCAKPMATKPTPRAYSISAVTPCATSSRNLNWYPRATTKLRPTRSPRKTHPARTHLINGLGNGTAFSPAARIQQCCGLQPSHKRFYEKVIKVKADVAALLNLFSDVSHRHPMVTCGAVK